MTGFVRDLIGAGYRGPLSLEIFNDDFRAAPARLMARDGLRSLLLVEAEAGATVLEEASVTKIRQDGDVVVQFDSVSRPPSSQSWGNRTERFDAAIVTAGPWMGKLLAVEI